MKRLAVFAQSLAGRIALLLASGTMLAVAASLFVAEKQREIDFRRMRAERVLSSAVDLISRLRRDPVRTTRALADDQIIGAVLIGDAGHVAPSGEPIDESFAERLAPLGATLSHVRPQTCTAADPFWSRPRIAGMGRLAPPDCWLLSINQRGAPIFIALNLPPVPKPPSMLVQPLFLLLMAASCVGLSLIAARLATAPLRRLTAASSAFARSIDAEPAPEAGPIDVREALATFNLMQARVRESLQERTRLLAAISHDLQTPLTRLRLRLEKVEDEALRARLLADLSATMSMVRRGLDLARSGDSSEPWTAVDLDSLLSSLADDAAEAGQNVRFLSGCGGRIRTKLDALSRCLGNLLDNAVRYGGGAELSCVNATDGIRIIVRDHGPGIEPELVDRAFEPFVRGDIGRAAGEGTGIGLAIARAQAAAIGANLALRNHPDGGVEVMMILPS